MVFAIGASIAGAIFLVSLVELILTVRRRKIKESLEKKLADLKAAYNMSVSQLTLEKSTESEKLSQIEQQLTEKFTAEKTELEKDLHSKVSEVEKKANQALNRAKEKAKALQAEAQLKAEEYLEKRRDEVEDDLQELVLSITKRVLPEGLTYEVHRDLIAAALKEAKLTGGTRGRQTK
jgi:flagellar biosynthesis/type III secretory pathway protein FliH